MRIFVSFASEQEALAEPVAFALRSRGHSVFFSHDDLPPGGSFDEKVERAITDSDVLVFLISAESVTRGRYTLTELAFARTKWPNPSGRVLPVMLTDTPLDKVPNYLKAVTILEPAGNAAAETAAAVGRMANAAGAAKSTGLLTQEGRKKFALYAGLAILSALATYWTTHTFNVPPTFSFVGRTNPTSIVPGILFGLVIAFCCYRAEIRDRFNLFLVVAFTTIGWITAVDTSLVIFEVFSGTKEGVTGGPTAKQAPLVYVFCGVSGGLVGSAFTAFGVAIASVRFRHLDRWAPTVLIGGLFGALVLLLKVLEGSDYAFLILYLFWQPAVLLSIAWALEKPSIA